MSSFFAIICNCSGWKNKSTCIPPNSHSCFETFQVKEDVVWLDHSTAFYTLAFQFLMISAFTQDFSNRVSAVSSGMLYGSGGHDPLESPLAGRSARVWCFLAAGNNWLAVFSQWANSTENSYFPSVFACRIPQGVTLGGVLAALLALGCTLLSRCKPWMRDLVLTYLCVAPTLWQELNGAPSMRQFLQAYKQGHYYPTWHEEIFGSLRWNWLLIVASTQILIQAGCHPCTCIVATGSLICTVSLPILIEFRDLYALVDWPDCLESSLLGLGVLLSHHVDWHARMKAIHLGMQQSSENADAVQCAGRSREGLGPGDEMELVELRGRAEERMQDWAKAMKVGVVVHAETELHPDTDGFDLPITSEGLRDTTLLAEELKSAELIFDVVISSPCLCCLQTAWILGEHFGAKVLLDEDLGETTYPSPFTHALYPLDSGVKIGRVMDQTGESDLEVRYAKRFLEYLGESFHSKKNFLLVTHPRSLEVCMSILPPVQQRKIISLRPLATLLALRDPAITLPQRSEPPLLLPGRRCRSQSLDLPRRWKFHDPQRRLEELNELLQAVDLNSWSVWLRAVTTQMAQGGQGMVSSPSPSLGSSWEDLHQSLTELPQRRALTTAPSRLTRVGRPLGSRWGSFSTWPASSSVSHAGSLVVMLQVSQQSFEKYPAIRKRVGGYSR